MQCQALKSAQSHMKLMRPLPAWSSHSSPSPLHRAYNWGQKVNTAPHLYWPSLRSRLFPPTFALMLMEREKGIGGWGWKKNMSSCGDLESRRRAGRYAKCIVSCNYCSSQIWRMSSTNLEGAFHSMWNMVPFMHLWYTRIHMCDMNLFTCNSTPSTMAKQEGMTHIPHLNCFVVSQNFILNNFQPHKNTEGT